MATVAALENQLNREILQAESIMNLEKAEQSKQISHALDEYYKLHRQHEKDLQESVDREMKKNRGMTAENLEKTVIDMMLEIDHEKTLLAAEVAKAHQIANRNSELTSKNRDLYMQRELLLGDSATQTKRIDENDKIIRQTIEYLKLKDKEMAIVADEEEEADEVITNNNEEEDEKSSEKERDISVRTEGPDRGKLLHNFFVASVGVLTSSIVRILQELDPQRASEYTEFHSFFDNFDGRKKELRFLMSKLGNLTAPLPVDGVIKLIEIELVEGADDNYTYINLKKPQMEAILDFATPIGSEEFPELIASHFFQ